MTRNEKKLGKRIKEFRENYGFSQEKLANLIKVSRPIISQIETGARRVNVTELEKFSEIFQCSIDTLLDLSKPPEVIIEESNIEKLRDNQIRISVPQKNYEKFKEVFLYILDKVGSKSNIGESVIYKLLYFIDFDFYEMYEEQLIGATYIKNVYGPTPIEFGQVLKKMIKDGEIEKINSEYFNFPQTKYLPLRSPNLKILSGIEKDLIDDVLNRLSSMNATQISEYSHGDVPWLTAQEEKVIEYESVYYRTATYSRREYVDDISRI